MSAGEKKRAAPRDFSEARELGRVGLLGTLNPGSRVARDAGPDERQRTAAKYLRDKRAMQRPRSLSAINYEERLAERIRGAGADSADPLGRSRDTPEERDSRKRGRTLAARIVAHRETSGRAIFGESFQEEWNALRGRALARLDEGGLSHRQQVWLLRDVVRVAHPSERAAACGYLRIGQVGVVRRPAGPGWALTGVETCTSAHSCAVCACAIKGQRAAEIVQGVALHRERFGGHSLFLVTYTIRHEKGDSLTALADGLQRAWNRYKTRVPTLDKQERARSRRNGEKRDYAPGARAGTFAGMVGGVYGQEVTHGENGWHVHRHEVLCFDRELSPRERKRLEARAAAWWAECVGREMGEKHRPSWRRGLRVDALNDARYIAKLGLEVADVGIKKSANRNQWDLLWDASEGCAQSLDLAAEYVQSMRGRKAVQFSERLLELWQQMGWKRAATDEEIVSGADGVPLSAEIPARSWIAMRQSAAVCAALELEHLPDVLAELRRLAPDWIGNREWGAGRRAQLDAARYDQAKERRAIQDGVTRLDQRVTLLRDRWRARERWFESIEGNT